MKKLLIATCLSATLLTTGCVDTGLSAGTDFLKAATMTDEDAIALAAAAKKEMDASNDVAPAKNKYAKRLAKITKGLENEDGLNLDFKVYLVEDINAFAMADGTVRVYSGLMDILTDDEIRFVIGHEVGHVKLGHSKKAAQVAYASSGVQKGAAAAGGKVGALSQSQLGNFANKLVNSQFSQSQETDADTYAVKFMKRHGWDPKAGIGVMKKFQQMEAEAGGSGHSVFSSHPASDDREEHIRDLL
jgi:putative metalloprotease